MYEKVISFIREQYQTDAFIPLHEPRFVGNEKKYLNDCIDSTFVSSVGAYVDKFEAMTTQYTGAGYAVATVNGTAALHIALLLADVKPGDEVITQPLTFIATCNAINYCDADPVFVDVDRHTLGLSPDKLEHFLNTSCEMHSEGCFNKLTGRRIAACVPMHTFGHPCRIGEIAEICEKFSIRLVEDAAESLGSTYKSRHAGTFGRISAVSFNGNKIITTGGGGMILCDDEALAKKAKHLTTTAKVPHKWEYVHDTVGYNYRLPNLNAALGCAQLESLDAFLTDKRELAEKYRDLFDEMGMAFITEPEHARSNYWLNAVVLENSEARNSFLDATNSAGVMTRPIWKLMNKLEMFKHCLCGDLNEAEWLEERVVNIPSGVRS